MSEPPPYYLEKITTEKTEYTEINHEYLFMQKR